MWDARLRAMFGSAAFDVNTSPNCEARPACEEGRRSEMKELPRLIPNAVHHELQAAPGLVWPS